MIKRMSVPESQRSSMAKFSESPRYEGRVFEDYISQKGAHPSNWRDVETAFAADALRDLITSDARILDIGSNHLFVTGLCAFRKVSTVDVRPRAVSSENENVIISDARAIPLPNQSFDVVISLNALEHFGLGRYGDDIEVDADMDAIREVRRLMSREAVFIFSTTLSSLGDSLAYNAHRIYSLSSIRGMLKGLQPVREACFSNSKNMFVEFENLETAVGDWDLYMGVWRAP